MYDQEVLITVRATVTGLKTILTDDSAHDLLFQDQALERLIIDEVLDIHGVDDEATFVG